MTEWWAAAGAAFWLGILTAISPCLMGTNVAAITFIARRVDRLGYVLLSGLFYIVGQALTYVVLAMVLVSGLIAVPVVSHGLQKYMLGLLGPILILAGIFMLELLSVRFGDSRVKAWAQGRADSGGVWVAALLGVVFGMSFCPTTAALYFGGLIPLAVGQGSRVLLPSIYAMGVAVPVLLFGLVIAFAANKVGKAFAEVRRVEWWARRVTGVLFLVIGIYFTLDFTVGLF